MTKRACNTIGRRAPRSREDALGCNDPATAQTMNSLSAVYVGLRRYAEAERLGRLALSVEEMELGQEDPRIVVTLGNLSHLYLRRQAARSRRATDGARHGQRLATRLEMIWGLWTSSTPQPSSFPKRRSHPQSLPCHTLHIQWRCSVRLGREQSPEDPGAPDPARRGGTGPVERPHIDL